MDIQLCAEPMLASLPPGVISLLSRETSARQDPSVITRNPPTGSRLSLTPTKVRRKPTVVDTTTASPGWLVLTNDLFSIVGPFICEGNQPSLSGASKLLVVS